MVKFERGGSRLEAEAQHSYAIAANDDAELCRYLMRNRKIGPALWEWASVQERQRWIAVFGSGRELADGGPR